MLDVVGVASATCKLPVLHKEGPNPYTRVQLMKVHMYGMQVLASIIIIVARIHF